MFVVGWCFVFVVVEFDIALVGVSLGVVRFRSGVVVVLGLVLGRDGERERGNE